MSQKTCVIVGAGAGGLGCSAALLKHGYKTTIFERESIIGGAARTLDVYGFSLDEGIHYLVDIKGKKRHVDEVGNIFGLKHDIAVLKGPNLIVVYKGEEIDMLKLFPISQIYDRAMLKKVFNYLSDSDIDDVEAFAKLMIQELQKTIAELNLKSFDDILLRLPYVPLKDWISERTKNENVLRYVLDIAQVNIMIPTESVATCSAYAVLALFMGLSSGMFKYCYPVHEKYGGLEALLGPYADYIRANGGEICTNVTVKKIKVDDGVTKGVIIVRDGKEEFVEADVVVCNVPPQLAAKMGILDINCFPDPYKEDLLKKINTIREGAKRYDVQTLNLHIGLKKQITDIDSYIVFVGDGGHVIGGLQSYSVYSPKSAPPGKQLLYLISFLYKQPRNYKIAENYVHDLFLPAIRQWLKDFDDNVEWIMTSFSPIPYAELNQQMFSSTEKFDIKTGIDNLYFAGMYTGLVGVDGALVTGVRAAELILDKKIL